uniref:Uncharacterized protein n=1 Tax=Panagrolaimus sp. PS1159 TaxID=55785 RepID=A0AC35F9K3_9BILA
MSLTGSGRFRSVYVDDFDRHSSFSSSGKSGVFNPNGFVNGGSNNDNNGIISYEPGSGAEYMYSKGWHARDPYGKPLPTLNRSIRNTNLAGVGVGGVRFDSTKSDDLLARENR